MGSVSGKIMQKQLKHKLGSLLLIFILICSGSLVIISLNQNFNNAHAISTWTQTSDKDFENGTSNNITIVGIGENAELRIDTSNITEWRKKSPHITPTGRYLHAMASIYGDDKVLMFGGLQTTGNDETWVYDLSDDTWMLQTPPTNPGIQYAHAMASIYGDDKVLLFGTSETWAYDLSANEWVKKASGPSARSLHCMASIYGDDKVVMFSGGTYPNYYEDTWVYDLSDDSWTEKKPMNNPIGRASFAMASIYGTDKVLLFGGFCSSSPYRYDTWVYDLSDNTWLEKTPLINPGERDSHTMATIFYSDKVVLFGGYGSSAAKTDTWVYDLSDNTWVKKTQMNTPNGSQLPAMAAVYGTDSVVYFGGYGGGFNEDTWVYKHFLPQKNGTYISKPFDTGSKSKFYNMKWYGDVPENTSMKFQLRTAGSEFNLSLMSFVGPDGNSSTYYNLTPAEIWSGHTGDRWVQYKIYFNISNYSPTSPSFEELTISYNCLPKTIVLSPVNNSLITNNRPIFKWTFEDFDSEKQKSFQVLISEDINFKNITFDSGAQITGEQYWEFPTGTNYSKLPDGRWYWKVRTCDHDGAWTEYSSYRVLNIDTRLPSSAPIQPVNNMYYFNLPKMSGIATDPPNGSGIKKVEIAIKRQMDDFYWDGSAWSATPKWLLTSGTTNWTYNSSNIFWQSGVKYSVQSRAMDFANLVEVPDTRTSFAIDRDNPMSNIESPVDNVWLSHLNMISGSSLDIGGSGLKKVELNIFQTKNENYWNGTAWTKYESWLTAEGTNQWSYNSGGVQWLTGEQYIIRSRATDYTNNIEALGQGTTFSYDSQPPKPLSISINNGDKYTRMNTVELSLTAEDFGSGVSQMSFSNDNIIWSSWEAFNSNYSFNLFENEGENCVYFRACDFAGNIAESVFDTIILDTTPPEMISIVINGNEKYTNSKDVTLSLYANDSISGISEMAFSFDGITWSSWEPFNDSKILSLPTDDGIKNVYFKVSDFAGNIAESIFDSIILDTTPPHSLSISIYNGAIETNSIKVILVLNAIDDFSGISQSSFSVDNRNWSAWERFTWAKYYELTPGDGVKTIYFKAKDKLGNTAEPVSTFIILNTTIPPKDTQVEKKSDADNDLFWIYLTAIIIIIIILIIVGLAILIKRRMRVHREHELLPPGTVTIKPGGLFGPVISVKPLPTYSKPPELPSTVTKSDSQSPTISTTSVPMLPEATKITQTQVAQPATEAQVQVQVQAQSQTQQQTNEQ